MNASGNLNNIIKHIRADQAWRRSQGAGVNIAIIDTGICGEALEFPDWKRSPHCWPNQRIAWQDAAGHGSMVAAIAAGSTQNGGRYNGVAPAATIISCRTNFDEQELVEIYQYLINLVRNGQVSRLVINNSYGWRTGVAIENDINGEFPKIVRAAVEAGIIVVFPAGNNHCRRAGHAPDSVGPNTIWGVNSLDEVICVGCVDRNNRLDRPHQPGEIISHCDSSRGPGQWATKMVKPDCVAPVYGEVMWGSRYLTRNCWGTSGAAPMVAGLAALLASELFTFTPQQIQNIIKNSCKKLPFPQTSVGSGLIDCNAAMELALAERQYCALA